MQVTDELPYNDYYEYYAPDFNLHVPPNATMENANTRQYLESVKQQVFENLRLLNGAPGVQMQQARTARPRTPTRSRSRSPSRQRSPKCQHHVAAQTIASPRRRCRPTLSERRRSRQRTSAEAAPHRRMLPSTTMITKRVSLFCHAYPLFRPPLPYLRSLRDEVA